MSSEKDASNRRRYETGSLFQGYRDKDHSPSTAVWLWEVSIAELGFSFCSVRWVSWIKWSQVSNEVTLKVQYSLGLYLRIQTQLNKVLKNCNTMYHPSINFLIICYCGFPHSVPGSWKSVSVCPMQQPDPCLLWNTTTQSNLHMVVEITSAGGNGKIRFFICRKTQWM